MKRIPYSPPKCTVCGHQATVFAENKEPRCVRHQNSPSPTKPCPRCGGMMIVRENKRNHTYFWGCSNFPKCTGTASI